MKKKPMTTRELFNKICNILKEQDKLPDILDYKLATYEPVPIKNCQFYLTDNLTYGRNEGIYLSLYLECHEDGSWVTRSLGTFKTLYEDAEAMHTMAALLADFIIEERAYVKANLDDFTWEGADVYMFDENGKKLGWGYSCGCMENALKRKDELLKSYPKVAVRDNATRREKYFIRQAVEVTDERKEGTEDVQAG